MSIGDVFARAWDLWRRDVGWLVLAGLVVGLIMAVIFAVSFGIFAAIFAGAGLTIGADLADDTTGSLTGLGAGMLIFALLVYLVMLFLVQVLGMTFYGGMFQMVIGAYKAKRNVVFGDLFSGFRKFGSYALFALVLFGVSIGLNLLNVIPLIGAIIGFVVSIWISIIWLYVLPLIADRGIGFGEAASTSHQMVKGAGWWWTFGMVILLGLATAAAATVILLVAWGVYQGSEVAGILIGLLLFLVFAVLFPPYAICYVSVLYLASGGDAVVAASPTGGLPGIPPAPPAPPAYGAQAYGTPASPTVAGQAYGATGATAPSVPPPGGADAWKVAADPLAGHPPPLAPAASAPPAEATDEAAASDDASAAADSSAAGVDQADEAADDARTAVTDATAEAPEPPEPPTPPVPPVQTPQG